MSALNQASDYQKNRILVEAAIAAAARRAGRNPQDIRLIGVTKTVPPEDVSPLLDAGIREFGENRWQQAKPKLESPRASEAVWHFIGRLQTNKIKYVVPHFAWIHSIDSFELAQAVSDYTARWDKPINVLIQVNVSGELSKGGLSPDDVVAAAKRIHLLPGLRLTGLMTMAPEEEMPEATRTVFSGLRQLLSEVQSELGDPKVCELSMGMSNDFEIAVEEGATMVRIGRRLMDPSYHHHS